MRSAHRLCTPARPRRGRGAARPGRAVRGRLARAALTGTDAVAAHHALSCPWRRRANARCAATTATQRRTSSAARGGQDSRSRVWPIRTRSTCHSRSRCTSPCRNCNSGVSRRSSSGPSNGTIRSICRTRRRTRSTSSSTSRTRNRRSRRRNIVIHPKTSKHPCRLPSPKRVGLV